MASLDVRRFASAIPGLLIGIDVPDDVIRETDDLIPGSLGHLGKALCLGLVLERVAGEVDTFRGVSSDEGDCVRTAGG